MNIIYRIIPIAFIFLFASSITLGQELGFKQPSIASPSANEATKAINVPVSHYSGQSSVNIPIVAATSKSGLSIPVSLSYNNNGIKLNQFGTEVGLGWNLSHGASITREVRGLPDELKTMEVFDVYDLDNDNDRDDVNTYDNVGYLYHNYTQLYDDLGYYESNDQLNDEALDTEPDIFHFRAGSYAGSFIFDENGDVKMLNDNDVEILISLDPNFEIHQEIPIENFCWPEGYEPRFKKYGIIEKITIITPDGHEYMFDNGSFSFYLSGTENFGEDELPHLDDHPSQWGHYTASFPDRVYDYNYSWNISSIWDHKSELQYSFSYEQRFWANYGIKFSAVLSGEDFMIGGCSTDDRKFKYQRTNIFEVKDDISTIEAYQIGGTQTIEFNYNQTREDIFKKCRDQAQFLGMEPSKLLSTIDVFSYDNSKIKEYSFDLDLFPEFKGGVSAENGDYLFKRYKLNNITLTGLMPEGDFEATGPIDLYKFTYDETPMPPTHSYQKDLWGLYNGDANNPSYEISYMLPKQYVYPEDSKYMFSNGGSPYSTFPLTHYTGEEYIINENYYNNRHSTNEDAAQSCILKSIENAAGAKTNIEYELNEFVDPNDLLGPQDQIGTACYRTTNSVDPVCSTHDPTETFNLQSVELVEFDFEDQLAVFEDDSFKYHQPGSPHTYQFTVPDDAVVDLSFSFDISSDPFGTTPIIEFISSGYVDQVNSPYEFNGTYERVLSEGTYSLKVDIYEQNDVVEINNFMVVQSETDLQLELKKDALDYKVYPKGSFVLTEYLEAGQYEANIISDNSLTYGSASLNISKTTTNENPVVRQGGGLRVRAVHQYDGVNTATKRYSYSCDIGEYGYLLQHFDFAYNAHKYINECEGSVSPTTIIEEGTNMTSEPQGVNSVGGSPVVAYTNIIEDVEYKNSDDETEEQGYIEYNYYKPNLYPYFMKYCFSGTCIDLAPEHLLPNYTYWEQTKIYGRVPFTILPSHPLQSGVLKDKSVYSESSVLLNKEEYLYAINDYTMFPSFSYFEMPYKDYPNDNTIDPIVFPAKNKIVSYDFRKEETKTYTHGDEGGTALETTNTLFYEDPELHIPTRSLTTTADGNTVEVTTTYPTGSSESWAPDLVNENRLYIPVSKRKEVNGQRTEGYDLNFASYPCNLGNCNRLQSKKVYGLIPVEYEAFSVDVYNSEGQPEEFYKFGDDEKHFVTYDALGRVVSYDHRDMNSNYVYYGDYSFIKEKKEHGDILGAYKYDKLGRVVEKETRDGNLKTTYTYEINDGVRITKINTATDGSTIPNEIVQTDALGKTLTTTIEGYLPDGGNYITGTTYDALGRKIKECDPTAGSCTTYEYLPFPGNRIVEIGREDWPRSKGVKRMIDGTSMVKEVTDEDAYVVKEYTNGLGWKTATEKYHIGDDPADHLTTSYDHYTDGRLKEVIQPKGTKFTYTYQYNTSEKQWTNTKSIPGTTGDYVSIIDLEGKEVQSTDPNGNLFEYVYDVYDRVEAIKINGVTKQDFTYYDYGSTVARGDRGQVQEEDTYMLGSTTDKNNIKYTYDQYGRVTDEIHTTIHGTDVYSYPVMNLRDEVKTIQRTFTPNSGDPIQVDKHFEYYKSGDIKSIDYDISDGTDTEGNHQRVAEYYLKNNLWLDYKKVGISEGEELTKVDFKYNQLGWLTDINDVKRCNPEADPEDDDINDDDEEGSSNNNHNVTIKLNILDLLYCYDTEISIFINGELYRQKIFEGTEEEENRNDNWQLYNFEFTFNTTFETENDLRGILKYLIYETAIRGVFYYTDRTDDPATDGDEGMINQFLSPFFEYKEGCTDLRQYFKDWLIGGYGQEVQGKFVFDDGCKPGIDWICSNLFDIFRKLTDDFEDEFPWIEPYPVCEEAPVLFAERIHYDHKLEDLSDKEQYSGLISGMEWRVLDEPIRMYGFHYDSQKRLSRANYAHQMPMYGAESEDVGGFNTIYAYDDNGNITLLKRKGITNYIPDPGYYVYGDIDWLNMSYEGNRLKTVGEPTSISQAHGYKSLGEEFTYDAAGNVTYDGGKGADFKNYNALDLPTEVERITSTGTITGKVVNTYDASGTKWSTDHTYYNQGSHNQNIKYVNGLELLDNGQFVLHHEEGRYVSDVGESNYEFVISDHLGNGRVWFQDLDGDGDLSLDPANLEVKQVKHYYPFGMTMGIQSLQTYAPPTDRNQYNGIEFFEGLDYNMAFYRTLDPGIGRWLQVDPKAEAFYGISPYAAMGNNPVSNVDPEGDFFFVAALGPILSSIVSGAIVGAAINGTITAATGGNFFDGAWKGAVTGALSGGLGAIGGGTFAANLALGTAEGAITGGVGSVLNGGNFWDGAKWGAITGALATTASSENLKNAFKGEGFRTNSKVFDAMIERSAGKQNIIDYFGMDAAFDPKMSADAKFWMGKDGSYGISLGESAFDSYDVLKSNYLKESFHMKRYLSGNLEIVPDAYTSQMKFGLEEYAGAKWNYRNQGLYSKSPTKFYDIIKNVENQFLSPFGTSYNSFNRNWWHFAYKIPRRY